MLSHTLQARFARVEGDDVVAAPSEDAFDVMLAGPLFFDLVLSSLDAAPAAGTEVQAGEIATSPGGIANLAVAAGRLGLRTGLATTFGDDIYGRWCWEFLEHHERIDLSRSRRLTGWSTPVTVSIAADGDRSMVTRGDPSPISSDDLLCEGVSARTALADLTDMGACEAAETWWQRAARSGTRIFADIGWDSSGRWDPVALAPLASCYAFTPNAGEAMAYTRTSTPHEAARALAERVPLVVVTCGSDGAIAVDAATGATAEVPPVAVDARDATGAGDVFGACLVLGTMREWPLDQSLNFAALGAALAVEGLGGALATPGWGDIADWWHRTRAEGTADVVARYGFLTDLVAEAPTPRARRGATTFPFAEYTRST
jgi:sugar/nucleoside kinase (ribokinase family)